MRLLIVEDNPRILAFLRQGLTEEGYVVESADGGTAGLELARTGAFDVAVIDVMLPDLSGVELVRALRTEGSGLPVLLLTARDAIDDKIAGLDAGADDYLTKPFDFPELTARIRALLRRSTGTPSPLIRVGQVELDPLSREVRRGGEPVQLTPKEFSLLEYLLRNPNRSLSRAMLMDHVWGIRFDPGTNVVDVFINSLRNKVDPDRELIQTVRGVGYMVRTPEEPTG